MRFQLIEAAKEDFPVQRLCQVLDVSQSGSFVWRSRPAGPRQRVLLNGLSGGAETARRSHFDVGTRELL